MDIGTVNYHLANCKEPLAGADVVICPYIGTVNDDLSAKMKKARLAANATTPSVAGLMPDIETRLGYSQSSAARA